MSDEQRPGEIDYPAAKAQIETAVLDHLRELKSDSAELPNLSFEKGEFRFQFPASMDRLIVFEALQLIKNHIENLRVHTFEPGYAVFQSLGENLYTGRYNPSGIKYKFVAIGSTSRVEISRKGNLSQDEIQSCIQLFYLFHPKSGRTNPVEKLRALGINVYISEKNPETTEDQKKSGFIHFQPESGDPWSWIAGYGKTKQEVQESIILPMKNPEIFKSVAKMARGVEGGNMPKAILFEGPPGVGKTTMARIIAYETGIPLVYVPVENILSKYYGESAQNMAAIFDAAAEFETIILFLDEIDSLAGSREEGLVEATRRILSVLLRKIDGFESRDGVLTIGATNRAGDLDRALLSRFDQTIFFPLPDEFERAAIFSTYARHLDPKELENSARAAEGLSGRNIRDICEYAERRWARMLIAAKKVPCPPPAELYEQISIEKVMSPR
jgi:hypothetical protein